MSLGNFEVLSKLGEGAFSTVFKVQRKSDGQLYALKKVRLNPLKGKEKENALTEVRILASIVHEHIIGYKESFVEDNTLCIVMEFASGGDLLSKINAHKKNRTYFKEKEIWSIFVQAALGLKALHDMKILHRDIKSANIFLDQSGKVKIGDLNVAKVAKAGLVYTQTGTPYYASPEVWKDQPYDAKSDIWSLGCVLYEAASLHPPFRAADMKGLFRKVVKGDVDPLPSHYSPDLYELIRQMLKVNPLLRPSLNRLLALPIVKKNAGAQLISSGECSLINTIRMPHRIDDLSSRLPAPNYHRRVSIDKADLSQYSTPKSKKYTWRKVHKMGSPSVEIFEPLKRYQYENKKSPKGAQIDKPLRQDTIAARIKQLKGHYAVPGNAPKKNHKQIGKPVWWG